MISQPIGVDRVRVCRKHADSIGPIGVIGKSNKNREQRNPKIKAISQYFNSNCTTTRLKPIRCVHKINRVIQLTTRIAHQSVVCSLLGREHNNKKTHIMDNKLQSLRSLYSDAHKDLHGCRWIPATESYEELSRSYDNLTAELAEEIERNKNRECPFKRDERLAKEALDRATTHKPLVSLGDLWPI